MNFKILHYALGPSPYRSGGMTVYVENLIQAQYDQGNNISLLYPSGMSLLNYPNLKIRHYKKNKINYFELKNPLPVPILDGIKNPSIYYTSPTKTKTLLTVFLESLKPDIIHVHTLMGLPKCFLEIAKSLGIKLFYTAHDYYGLCPKTNFINNVGTFCGKPSIINCSICNQNAPNHLYIRLRNEPFILKNKETISHFKFSSNKNTILKQSENKSIYNEEYAILFEYYKSMFSLFDKIHFNSTVTENVFKKLLSIPNSLTLPITHNQIKDNRKIRDFNEIEFRLGYIGNLAEYKGFPFLKKILIEIFQTRKNWILKVWGNNNKGNDKDCPNIIYKGRYNNQDIEKIFNEIDLLIVPSICKETFSLVTLEALSFGIPVIVSSNVGAKDIIKQYDNKFIYQNENELKSIITEILDDKTILINYNKSIMKKAWGHSMDSHVHNITNLIYK